MRVYHGTPIGGSRQDAARFLVGRSALVPYPRQDDLGAVAAYCQSFILDNGAFSIWKKGGVLDVEGYCRWVEKMHRHPGFDWALIPDVIDGNESDNNAMLEDWPRSLRHCGVPVWHMHEDISRLQALCVDWRTVALGSSGAFAHPGTEEWWERMAEAMDAICDPEGRPFSRLHGLRMLNPAVFTNLPLASADSTNAAVNCGSLSRFGMYVPPTSSQRAAVIASKIEHHNSSAVWERGKRSRPQPGHLLDFNTPEEVR